MTEKNDVQVIIDGKVLTIKGYESVEYLQKVATYINDKIDEYNKLDMFRHSGKDIQHRLIELNIADDYFKAKELNEKYEQELKLKQEELYNMKHDNVNKDMMLKQARGDLNASEEKNNDLTKRIAVLETEMKAKDAKILDYENQYKKK